MRIPSIDSKQLFAANPETISTETDGGWVTMSEERSSKYNVALSKAIRCIAYQYEKGYYQ